MMNGPALSDQLKKAVDAMNLTAGLMAAGVPADRAKSLRLYNIKISFDRLRGDPETEKFEAENPDSLAAFSVSAPKGTLKTIKQLWKLVRQYPNVPVLRNHLYVALRTHGDDEEAVAVCCEAHFLFPNYIYGFINYAKLLLSQDRIEDATTLFNGVNMPSDIDPERDTFHIAELIHFITTRVQWLMHLGNYEAVISHREMIEEMNVDHPDVDDLLYLIEEAEVLQRVRTLGAAASRKKAKRKKKPAKDAGAEPNSADDVPGDENA